MRSRVVRIPYIGIGVGWIGVDIDTPGSDEDGDAGFGRLEVGVKYFIAENVAISIAVRGEVASDDVYVNNDS